MPADDPLQAAFDAAFRAEQEALAAEYLDRGRLINRDPRQTNYAETLEHDKSCRSGGICKKCAAETTLRTTINPMTQEG